jgi:hypothetical protein
MIGEGGCLCGAVRYRFDAEPFGAGYCHCSMCRKSSGAPVIAAASVPRGSLVIARGEESLRRYRSSPQVTRVFCATCGGQLFFDVADEPDSIDLWLGSLDDPDAVPPTFHIYAADQVAWLAIHDDLPRYAQGRKGQPPLPPKSSS